MRSIRKSASCLSSAFPDASRSCDVPGLDFEDSCAISLRPHARDRTAQRRRNFISAGPIETIPGNSTAPAEKIGDVARKNRGAGVFRAFDAHAHQFCHGGGAPRRGPDELAGGILEPEKGGIAARYCP